MGNWLMEEAQKKIILLDCWPRSLVVMVLRDHRTSFPGRLSRKGSDIMRADRLGLSKKSGRKRDLISEATIVMGAELTMRGFIHDGLKIGQGRKNSGGERKKEGVAKKSLRQPIQWTPLTRVARVLDLQLQEEE